MLYLLQASCVPAFEVLHPPTEDWLCACGYHRHLALPLLEDMVLLQKLDELVNIPHDETVYFSSS